MSYAEWSLFLGLLLVTMVLLGSLLERLPLSSAMVYLGLGYLLGPNVLDVLHPDPLRNAAALERLAEGALLISLFAVGLKLAVPLRDPRWWLPVRLAGASMLLMVALVALVGVFALRLPIGVAVLLGAILAPTDPVLAAGVQSGPGSRPDRLGFSLAGEGGLNDGTSFPFVMLGLALTGGAAPGMHWWGVELLWGSLGGLLIGGAIGALTGRLVVHLRSRHHEAVGLDVFLGLGLVALVYGAAQLLQASGFLAVFAAGLALRRVHERPRAGSRPLPPAGSIEGHDYVTLATHSHHASATMRGSVQDFNEQLERLAELTLVLLVGAMLSYARTPPALFWFVPVLMLVLRPLSVTVALAGESLDRSQAALIAWFGIRGIGSVFYLLLALRLGVEREWAELLVSLTLWSVAASIVLHGVSAQPLMRYYLARHPVPRREA